MKTSRTATKTAIVTGAVIALLSSSAVAQTSPSGRGPTQRDVETCNHEAELSMGSALPRGSTIVPPTTGGFGATTPPPSAAGATGGTGSVSGGSTLANGAVAELRAAQTDPGYQQVYRDCMRRLGYAE